MKATHATIPRSSLPEAIDPQIFLGEILLRMPASVPVLAKLGFDADRDGELTFAEACRNRRLDAKTLGRALAALGDVGADSESPLAVELMSLAELCDHFEENHHGQIRAGLEGLERAVRDLSLEPGADGRRLAEIRARVRGFSRKLADHLREESEILFPLIRRLDEEQVATSGVLDLLKAPMAQMKIEHNEVDEELAALEALADAADGDVASASPCLRSLSDSLQKLEESLHGQIYQENQILFRRALARVGVGHASKEGIAT